MGSWHFRGLDSRVTCVMTPVLRGGPAPAALALGALERSSAWNRAVRAVAAGGTQTAVGSA